MLPRSRPRATGPSGSRTRSGVHGGVPDDGDGHRRAVHERVRDAAEHGAGERAEPARSHDQQLGVERAGGIGQDLMEAIRKFYYPDVSAILVLIIITVALIDLVTERVRHHFITQVS